jgi:Homoserine kinase
VVVPDFALPTTTARSVLPDCYSKEDVIFNLQRAALLVAALATGSTSAFPTALEDRLHQPYRAFFFFFLSGAGPSILVFYEKGCEQVCDLVRQIFALHGHQSEVMATQIARQGYTLG